MPAAAAAAAAIASYRPTVRAETVSLETHKTPDDNLRRYESLITTNTRLEPSWAEQRSGATFS